MAIQVTETKQRATGFIQIEDERDKNYPYSAIAAAPLSTVTQKYWWGNGWWGDQGSDPHCVAFAWTHWVNDGPRMHSLFKSRRPAVDTDKLYCEAQNFDPWPGNCENPLYEGTSVRAGAKVLQDWGFIENYYWAHNVDQIAQAIITQGPVIMGTRWTSGMSSPDRNGIVKPDGSWQGGHAYVLNGVNLTTRMFRLKNSWGRWWGKDGYAYISMDDMAALLAPYGEACVALQKKAAI